MKLYKKLIALAVAVLPTAANAEVNITFDTEDYQAVGVYDWWEASPFRSQDGQPAQLKGNCRVVANPYAAEEDGVNTSEKVLGFQRSRFGSNLFGARIDLKEDQRFELTPKAQYVHVLMRKPVNGRSMIIGLGRHNSKTAGYEETWKDQSPEVVQFTATGNNKAPADAWTDVVFTIKGAGNIDIYSLIVVPDCEAPHAYTEDFPVFIDNVKVNNSSAPEVALTGDYPVCFDKDQTYTRNDRKLNSLTITTAAGTYTKNGIGNQCWSEAFDGFINAQRGETVSVKCNYTGSWMHSFVYFDANNNGKFEVDEEELVAYKNTGSGDHSATHTFTIPENLQPGIYRLRGKVDWESTDPAGNDGSNGNYIISNGGGIIDVLFNVFDPEQATVSVNNFQRNGDILLADESKIDNHQQPLHTALTVKAKPENGFDYAGMILTCGYGIGGDSLVHSNPQYLSTTIPHTAFTEDDTYTIPAEYFYTDLFIEGLMVEKGTLPDPEPEPNPEDKEATFPFVSPSPIQGQWVMGTKSYHIQNGAAENGWVSTAYADASGYLRLDNGNEPEDQEGEWVVCGNDEDGYSFYNVAAGPTQVLGITGSEASARVKLYDLGQEGDAKVLFDFHENGQGFSFRIHGTEYNCFNSRNQYLALWEHANAFSSDNGSRFTFFEASDIEGIDPNPQPEPSATKFFTAEELRAEVAKAGVAHIGILNVTATSNKYVNGKSYNGVPASEDGTLEGVRAPQEDEIMEVYAVEDGYILRQADAEEGEGYLDCAAGGNFSVTDREGALVWQIVGHEEEGYGSISGYDDLYSDIEKEPNDYMIRFIALGQYLNGQNQGGTGGLRGGTGAWSFNYAYNVNYQGGSEPDGIGTVLAPDAHRGTFDLQGRPATLNGRGLFILNGKKVLR